MENPELKLSKAGNGIELALPKNNNQEHIFNGEKDFISNAEAFTCPLCSSKINKNQGITLQQCLHNFCKDCLCDEIESSVEATVQCPFLEYKCEEELLHSEIKSLVSKDIFDWHLQKSVFEYTGTLPLPVTTKTNINKTMEAAVYDYFPNIEEFQCSLCLNKIGRQKGVTLQDCLHNFCINCLTVTIESSKASRIQCPFKEEYICDEYILECEVRALVSKEIYENYIQRSIYEYSRETGENFGLDVPEFEPEPEVEAEVEEATTIDVKWKCLTCKQMNSDKKLQCVWCETKKSAVILQYNQLLELEESDLNLIENHNEFYCKLCLTTIGKGEGVLLRECLHEFCKECLGGLINSSDVPDISCPYTDDNYTCKEFLQDREIRSAITQEDYEKYLIKGLNLAENVIKNSYHCKTPDCIGWWIIEDRVNTIVCPVCQISNCLNCKVIHAGLNCKEYQDKLSMTDLNYQNEKTKKQLDELLRTGAAQKCPQCGVSDSMFYLNFFFILISVFFFRLPFKKIKAVIIWFVQCAELILYGDLFNFFCCFVRFHIINNFFLILDFFCIKNVEIVGGSPICNKEHPK